MSVRVKSMQHRHAAVIVPQDIWDDEKMIKCLSILILCICRYVYERNYSHTY
jgi:hypothetical protein